MGMRSKREASRRGQSKQRRRHASMLLFLLRFTQFIYMFRLLLVFFALGLRPREVSARHDLTESWVPGQGRRRQDANYNFTASLYCSLSCSQSCSGQKHAL